MRNRIIGLLATGLAVSLAGCGEANSTGYLALTGVSSYSIDETGCTIAQEKVPRFFYDAGIAAQTHDEYLLGLWFRNNLVANDDTDGTSIGRTNTNAVQVSRIVVEFTDRDTWGFLPKSIDIPTAFVIDTESDEDFSARLIPYDVVTTMVETAASPIREESATNTAVLPIRIRAEGKLMDGSSVESNEFDLNLTVCNGCLGGCAADEVATGCSAAQPDLFECTPVETPAQ